MVVGLCNRLDCVGGVTTKLRLDPLVAPEVLLEEGLAVLDIAAKRLDEPGSVVEIETSISILIEMLMSIILLSKRYSFPTIPITSTWLSHSTIPTSSTLFTTYTE